MRIRTIVLIFFQRQIHNYVLSSDFFPQKKYILVLGPGCGPKPKINSEFYSIHFGIEINKCLKFLTPKNV